jgi:hypothetical protein
LFAPHELRAANITEQLAQSRLRAARPGSVPLCLLIIRASSYARAA